MRGRVGGGWRYTRTGINSGEFLTLENMAGEGFVSVHLRINRATEGGYIRGAR